MATAGRVRRLVQGVAIQEVKTVSTRCPELLPDPGRAQQYSVQKPFLEGPVSTVWLPETAWGPQEAA